MRVTISRARVREVAMSMLMEVSMSMLMEVAMSMLLPFAIKLITTKLTSWTTPENTYYLHLSHL